MKGRTEACHFLIQEATEAGRGIVPNSTAPQTSKCINIVIRGGKKNKAMRLAIVVYLYILTVYILCPRG